MIFSVQEVIASGLTLISLAGAYFALRNKINLLDSKKLNTKEFYNTLTRVYTTMHVMDKKLTKMCVQIDYIEKTIKDKFTEKEQDEN